MEREQLIKKWLDNELTETEQRAFEKLPDHAALVRIAENSKGFTAPEYDVEAEGKRLSAKLSSPKMKKLVWWKPLTAAAAVALICMLTYFGMFNERLTQITTLASVKTEVSLPDASVVKLNALSSLSFNKKTWADKREVFLQGEAFFKVAKGSTFDVNTKDGVITVLGTQFNVKHRDDYFEVVCYEGLVQVVHQGKTIKLPPNHQFRVIKGKPSSGTISSASSPSWLDNESNFVSVPFSEVIKEFERQYKVKVSIKNVNLEQLFTGGFTHIDKELALKSITLPMNLEYTSEIDQISIEGTK